ncbi:MAG: anhydro-N-acetylmuramic acid kinase [Ostreibacterium sp.]
MYYIGMMSGTSLDGIDGVLAYQDTQLDWQVCYHIEHQLPNDLRHVLYHLNFPKSTHELGELHTAQVAEYQLTQCYAEVYQKLIKQSGIPADKIKAIGAHGQTIRHEPNIISPYTIQLLNGALLSQLTGQTVVCDFRRKDIAAGGQGAPLAPIFHAQLFPCLPPFAVVNIGGIANVSLIRATVDGSLVEKQINGFDCGPGNCLMDEWIARHQQRSFDEDGQWASAGSVIPSLLETLLADTYFHSPVPKSTGRDYFNTDWLNLFLKGNERPQDIMRTLAELTVKTIINTLPDDLLRLIIVGGGAKNTLLVSTIERQLKQKNQYGKTPPIVQWGEALGFDAQQVEALGFALLAKSCIERQLINTTSITGASSPIICGAIYY